jgi:protein N-terminal amidase
MIFSGVSFSLLVPAVQVNDAFSIQGYVFPNAPSIAPYLEQPKTGPTSVFCKELAERLGCYVVAGYPERLKQHEVEKGTNNDGAEVDKIGANSAVLYGPGGEWIGGYRKTNLYETDMTWAKAGNRAIHYISYIQLN